MIKKFILLFWAKSMFYIIVVISGFGMCHLPGGSCTVYDIPFFFVGSLLMIFLPSLIDHFSYLGGVKSYFFPIFLISMLAVVNVVSLFTASYQLIIMAQSSFQIDDIISTSVYLTVLLIIIFITSITVMKRK